MQEIKSYNNNDLVLSINETYDHNALKLEDWEDFLDILCGDREYQKNAIKKSIIYLCSNNYQSLRDLAIENYNENLELQSKYNDLNKFLSKIQMPGKLSANIDLATGTGKSYVIYGIAQIMLSLGFVKKVLVLCPSVTIEDELKKKFIELSSNELLKKAIPVYSKFKNPSIVDANSTVKDGDICIENIHAIYDRTNSSIEDSFKHCGADTLVLNDESHHIYNNILKSDSKKWKEFLLNSDYNFKYILGFTGTAYIENEYFNDVIYRYSLKTAIEDRVVKNIDYVFKDESISTNEKFQKIYQNHIDNKDKYPKVRPLTIMVTKDIGSAENLEEDLKDFLIKKENTTLDVIQDKVLIVTSSDKHKNNLIKLKNVDSKTESKVEWIISVSMLTEGWDVKNVFQIVPWEDRAFNSKLLISQVLGRGLRLPIEYQIPQPKVVVFNHDSWSKNIKGLINEILEIETRIESNVVKEGERSKYNFVVYNIDYEKIEIERPHLNPKKSVDFSRLESEGISLESQVLEVEHETSYSSVLGFEVREKNYLIEYGTYTVDEIVDTIYENFENRDWEGKVLQLGKEKYTQNSLPPRSKVEKIIYDSMKKRGIKGDRLIAKNRNKILQSFGTMLRKQGKTVIQETKPNQLIEVSTMNICQESMGIKNFRKEATIFYCDDYKELLNDESIKILDEIIDDESLPKSSSKHQNKFQFKTPMNIVLTKGTPERAFVDQLCKIDVSNSIESWIKSRDVGFYSIEYSWRKSTHQKINNFNPDFFIKVNKGNYTYYIVVEIKSDDDVSDENKAKYKCALEHFETLNYLLETNQINEKYIFHFLSPSSYAEFFEYLKNGTILQDQSIFRCDLENKLEEK